MKYSVILIKKSGSDIRATVPGLPNCSVRAETRDEALKEIQHKVDQMMHQIEIVEIDVPAQTIPNKVTETTPWEFFGTFRNDPAWGELFDEIEDRRSIEK